ncbi:MAG: TIGR02647 family protein [Gammaproteobacteria bacterium]|nr:TIGR02647 family protein [Gammaproteobacteria bacterium]
MPYTPEQMDELAILALYNLTTSQEGIKVHGHTAEPNAIAAAERLFSRGFVTQVDGGYLTDLGREAAEHAQALRILLASDWD